MTLRRVVILTTITVVLEVICRAGWVRPTDLVPPTVMLRAMALALIEASTLFDFWVTLSSVLASVIIAILIGIIAGIVLYFVPRVRSACEPLIASYYALP